MRGNKRDRIARLLKVEHLLCQAPDGLTFQEIAQRCGVSTRTARRDVAALELELGLPIWEEKGRRGIDKAHFLPPISLSLPEAMTLFLSARLLLSYSNAYNPNIDSTFTKLNSIVPLPLRDQIDKTMRWMQKLKKDQRFLRTIEILANAWMNGKKVKIQYLTLGQRKAKERIIEPYFIQPAALEHANYVIAYCNLAQAVRTFKIERIVDIGLLDENYTVPPDFDANAYLGAAWGISVYGDVSRVRLKFSPEVAPIAQETSWHPSQVTQLELDGSAMVSFTLPVTTELEAFILGWGEKVEVIEPESLRRKIAKAARQVLKVYRK